MKKVLIVDTVHFRLLEGIADFGYTVVEDYISPKESLIGKIKDYTGLVIRSRFLIDRAFLKRASKLKFIARVGAGLENIDVHFAKELGIHLINAPEGNRDAVAEHVLGMLLMLLNKLKKADAEVRNGKWLREENRKHELNGKCVGIIGYGNMGSALAQRMQGFEVKVLAYDKYKTNFGNRLIEEVSLDTLKKETDILSLHIPYTAESYRMINKNFIDGFMKPFYLINTARGKIVQTSALVKALQSGKIRGACLDVLEYEKSSFESMFQQTLTADFEFLIQSDKVILSPHIAGWTYESKQKMAEVILDKLKKLRDHGI